MNSPLSTPESPSLTESPFLSVLQKLLLGAELLHPKVQAWIALQGWSTLRDMQRAAIPIIEGGKRDLIISAATASGKTEAAFLPLCSRLLKMEKRRALILALSPLKALINDQLCRLQELFGVFQIPVCAWHGDSSQGGKWRFVSEPRGVLLITPESLEAMLMRHGEGIGVVFPELAAVVVDELHVFLGTPRGRQLQSLLHRLENALQKQVPRIALSATLGDVEGARSFLRPHDRENVEVVLSNEPPPKVRIALKTYPSEAEGKNAEEHRLISDDLYDSYRGSKSLVFANSRQNVEHYSDLLRQRCELEGVTNEFFPHHGSLSRKLRSEAEAAIKKREAPATVICTSTLEMGIDIGEIEGVAQIGVPPSVSSLRQRLGRSGRRGQGASLDVYLHLPDPSSRNIFSVKLHEKLVETVAVLNLLQAQWYEPHNGEALHLSVLAHQILSLLVAHRELSSEAIFENLIQRGAFREVERGVFERLLLSLFERDAVHRQVKSRGGDSDGTTHNETLYSLGGWGRRVVGHFSFFAVFATPTEFRVRCAESELGKLPLSRPLPIGSEMVFAGRRWSVEDVDYQKRVIHLVPAEYGAPPSFWGDGGSVHREVRREMLRLYSSKEEPLFLDASGRAALRKARAEFQSLGLLFGHLHWERERTTLFSWEGDRVNATLVALFSAAGYSSDGGGFTVCVHGVKPPTFLAAAERILSMGPPLPEKLAPPEQWKRSEKFDFLLCDALSHLNAATNRFDISGAFSFLTELVQQVHSDQRKKRRKTERLFRISSKG